MTLEPTLNEISGLTKMSVKHKGREKHLGRNATPLINRKNSKKKKKNENLMEMFRTVNVIHFTFLQNAFGEQQIVNTTFLTSDKEFCKAIIKPIF